ncbi:hypothetical protein BD770DRAFT_354453 [Pilaira anomala]|nr:hypothetical protein BD770DRAFT_354453 [Pilaira anomala]
MLNSYINEHKRVEIQQDKLVAAEFIKSGTTVLVQPPLASVPLPAKRHQRCNYCLRKAQLQCCSRCRSAYFCSNECFRNAWLHFHRVLCEPQETDIYKDVDADRWLLERTALTLHSHARLNKQYSHSPTHLPFAIHALQLHHTLNTGTPTSSSVVENVAQFLEPFDCQISSEELVILWNKIQAGSFPILDGDHQFEQVAVGLYPITSLFVTHSCRPNAAVLYKQDTQYIITLEDILPGEKITIAYVDLISTKETRLNELRKKFGQEYVCDCVRCHGELSLIDIALEKGEKLGLSLEDGRKLISEHLKSWSILDMLRDAEIREKDSWSPIQVLEPPQFTHFVSRISAPTVYYASIDDRKQNQNSASLYKAYVKEDRAHILQRLPTAMTALLNVPQVPSFTISAIKAAENLLIELISKGNWVQTSRCALYLFVVYRLIYPPFHPKLAYHTLILARSGWNALVEMELIGVEKKLERIYANGTRTWIELARDAIDTTFGRESNFWRDVIELQWVYEREQKVKGI